MQISVLQLYEARNLACDVCIDRCKLCIQCTVGISCVEILTKAGGNDISECSQDDMSTTGMLSIEVHSMSLVYCYFYVSYHTVRSAQNCLVNDCPRISSQ